MSEYRPDQSEFIEQIKVAHSTVDTVIAAVGRMVVGQESLRRALVVALLADGHILLEGVPGLAKTLSIKALASSIDASFKRIQFTPDLLPADLIGTEIYRPQDGRFEIRKGPVFTNLVLADEINRAPAKVQSALLETMQEKQVTIGNTTHNVPTPFLVMATQNPIEQEGTYPLPEAQIDRFIMKVKIDYPTPEEEKDMLELVTQKDFLKVEHQSVCTLEQIASIQELSHGIYVDDRVKQYIVDLVNATRNPAECGLELGHLIELGASPRATIALFLISRIEALLSGEYFVVPQNVKDVALNVLRHRVVPTYEAEAQGLTSDDLVKSILEGVQVP